MKFSFRDEGLFEKCIIEVCVMRQFDPGTKLRALGVGSVLLLLLMNGCGSNSENVPAEDAESAARSALINVAEALPPYVPGTPYWVPLIDECMLAGGNRNYCIESLPPEVLTDLERWEAANAESRRTLMRNRQPAFGVVPR